MIDLTETMTVTETAVTVELSGNGGDCWTPAPAACENWIRQALSTAGFGGDCLVSLHFAPPAEVAALNQKYRGRNKVSNVLSFASNMTPWPSPALSSTHLGDIVLCPQLVAEEARQQGKALEAHWAHLTMHGALHLIGHDHQQPAAAATMEAIEIQSLAALGYPDPYASHTHAHTHAHTHNREGD